MGLQQAGIPHKYPAKPKPAAVAAVEPEKAAAGQADKEGAEAVSAGDDASKPAAVPAPGVSCRHGAPWKWKDTKLISGRGCSNKTITSEVLPSSAADDTLSLLRPSAVALTIPLRATLAVIQTNRFKLQSAAVLGPVTCMVSFQVSKTAALAAAAAMLSDAVPSGPAKAEAAKGGSSARKEDSKSVKCACQHAVPCPFVKSLCYKLRS